jgi:ribose transport system substrate-binding protein
MGQNAMSATLDAIAGKYKGGWIETPTSIVDKDASVKVLQAPEKLFPQPSKKY